MVAVYVEQAICAYMLLELFSVNDDSASLNNLLNFLNCKDALSFWDPDEYNCDEILTSAWNKWETM